jgi:hypothetical protein
MSFPILPPLRAGFAAAAAVVLFAQPAIAADWTFTELPQASPPYGEWGAPAINDAGEVVFFTNLLDGHQAIVRLDANGPFTVAVADSAPFVSFDGVGSFRLTNDPVLDDLGRVAFRAYTYDPATWTYTGTAYLDDHGARAAMTGEFGGTGPWLDWCNPVMAGDGSCALFTWDSGTQVQTLWSGSAPTLSAVMDNSGSVASFTTEAVVAAGGRVAVRTSDDDNDQRILRCDGATATLIASRRGEGYYDYRDGLAVNAAGLVAYHVLLSEWVAGICTGDGGPPAVAVHNDQTGFDSFYALGLDAQGRLVFQASLTDWTMGIFDGPDPVADRVIARGDSLFGSTVSSLELGRHGVNAAGDVAFRYSLDDYRSGIAIARRTGGTGVGSVPAVAMNLACSPNPFNPRTTLSFTLDRPSRVRVVIHALDGRLAAVLADGERSAGQHALAWDGCDADGLALPSGSYLARLESASGTATTKLVLLR